MFNKIISSRSRTILLFFVVGFVCYGWILNSPFKLLDDYACIIQNPAIHSLSDWKKLFTDSFFGGDGAYYRPLVSLSFMLEYHFFKLQHLFYNLDNIFLHIGSSLLVWAILVRLLKDKTWAFFAAFLFLIHPMHWEQITNIPGRSILLCAFFILVAFYLLLKSLDKNESPSTVFLYYGGSLAAFMAGLLSKESAAPFPLIVVCLMMCVVQADLRKKIMLTAPYFILLGAYLWIRSHLGVTKLTHVGSWGEVVFAVMTFLKSLWIHAGTVLLPIDLIYDRSLTVFKNVQDPELWITADVWIFAVAAIVYFRQKISSLNWFWLAWIVLSFATVSQLIPIYVSANSISIADHFLYLPSVGIFVFLVGVVRFLFRSPSMAKMFSRDIQNFLVLVWFFFLIVLTIAQVLIAGNQFVMFERTLEDNPLNNRVRTALASAYGYAGMPEKAEDHFRQVLANAPLDAKARIGLGKALCDENHCLEAVTEYHKVFDPSPADAQILKDNLDKTYHIVIRDYEIKTQRDPQNAEFHNILGTMYMKVGRVEQGLERIRTALVLKPDFSEALFMLAHILEKTGDADGAIAQYRRFLDVVPVDEHFGRWIAYDRLSGLYVLKNQPEDAKKFKDMARHEQMNMSVRSDREGL